jgi:UDP-GlcNAc:undecaprenyl-phosphate GlcNAc-1-phosphate transferase
MTQGVLTLLFYAVAAFGLSVLLVPLCRVVALRFGLVARPRIDRWHGRPTALLGGVAIAVTVIGLHLAFLGPRAAPILFLAGAAVFLLGLADDLASLKPVTKLVFAIAVASFLTYFKYRLGWVTSLTADTVLTVLWIVAFTNAFNLLDNMDGLCAGLSLIAGTGVLAAFYLNGVSGPETVHTALLLGATAGFLVYNFHPASIFMGDSGSLFLGLNLSILTLSSPTLTHAPAGLLSVMAAPVLILLVPIVDTALVAISRILSGRSAAQGGRDHTSHRLVAIGLSERGAVVALWALSALGGLLAVAIQGYKNDLPSLIAAMFVIGMIILAVYLSHVQVYEEDETAQQTPTGVTPVVVDFVYRRRIFEVLLDVCLIAISYYSAYRLRFDANVFGVYFFPRFLESLPMVIGVQLVSLFLVGGYRGVWRYFGLMDGVTFAKGVALGTLVNVSLIVFVYRFAAYSRAVFVMYAALLMLLLLSSRASFRLISEFVHRRNQTGTRVAIYGAGDAAAGAARDILSRRYGGYRMLGFIVEDPSLERARMQGYPVIGSYDSLERLIREGKVDLVVITQLIDVERLERLRECCAEHRVSLERLHFALDQLVAS